MKPFDESQFDEIFRSKLGNFSETPPPQVMAKLQNSLSATPPPAQSGWLMRNWVWFAIIGVSAVVSVTLAFNYVQTEQSQKAKMSEVHLNGLNSSRSTIAMVELDKETALVKTTLQTETKVVETVSEKTVVVNNDPEIKSEKVISAKTVEPEKVIQKTEKKLPAIEINIFVSPSVCRKPNGEIKLTSANDQRYFYYWSDADANTSIATRTNLFPRKYTVRVVNEAGNEKYYDIDVADEGSVKAEFTHYEVSKAVGMPIYFENKSKFENSLWNENAGLTFKWYFGDNTSSVAPEPDHIYNQAGTYRISMVVLSAQGCKDSVGISEFVINGSELEMANYFTPNNDGINDFFTPEVTGFVMYTCSIFNRTGEKICEWANEGSWDGRIKGSDNNASPGVYYYVIEGQGSDGKKILKKGFVQLSR
ncbi:MAG: hypothetical protein CVU05_11250 [Bacteroidetes bacterium HGW-Bacteroidetes-21]|jgi:gliding motility-associated-like protein|nr:MAG: hypothetical protein CVU05_11250 [Bacteroidetes bacterium HGW-Bacteroidetes-21]